MYVFANIIGGCANEPGFEKFVFCRGKYMYDAQGPIDKGAEIIPGGEMGGLHHKDMYLLSVQYYPTGC